MQLCNLEHLSSAVSKWVHRKQQIAAVSFIVLDRFGCKTTESLSRFTCVGGVAEQVCEALTHTAEHGFKRGVFIAST